MGNSVGAPGLGSLYPALNRLEKPGWFKGVDAVLSDIRYKNRQRSPASNH